MSAFHTGNALSQTMILLDAAHQTVFSVARNPDCEILTALHARCMTRYFMHTQTSPRGCLLRAIPQRINAVPITLLAYYVVPAPHESYCAFFFFFFFFNLTYSRWTSSSPSCLWSLRIFPSLPGSRLTIFIAMQVQHSYNSSTNG